MEKIKYFTICNWCCHRCWHFIAELASSINAVIYNHTDLAVGAVVGRI